MEQSNARKCVKRGTEGHTAFRFDIKARKNKKYDFRHFDQVNTSEKADRLCREIFEKEGFDIKVREQCIALLFSKSLNLEGWIVLGIGGTSVYACDNLLLSKACVDTLAGSVILCHNHPSGNVRPSPQDTKMTESARKALDVFDIKLTDHIIIGEDTYFSFSEDRICLSETCNEKSEIRTDR